MLTSCQNFSESKISCWHSLNFPNGGKRSDVPSQTKHWETLQGEYYYPHLSADEMETQEVKILCPGSTAWKNWPECQKQHCVAPPSPRLLSPLRHGPCLGMRRSPSILFDSASLSFFQDNSKLIFRCFHQCFVFCTQDS